MQTQADPELLYRIFRYSYSSVDAERRQAEQWLQEARGSPGLASALLQLALCGGAESAIRQAAAIQLKNEVSRQWAAAGDASVAAAAQERSAVREQLIDGLAASLAAGTSGGSPAVAAQLLECFRVVASFDFPSAWPGLVDRLVSALRSDDNAQTRCALLLLRKLFKQLESRPASRREDMDTLCERTLPTMQTLAPALAGVAAQGGPHSADAFFLLRVLLKCFYSAIYMAVGASAQRDIDAWMATAFRVVEIPLGAAPSSAADLAAREAAPEARCRKWAFRILFRFSHRHGSPRRCVNGAEAFARAWAAAYEGRLAEVALREACARARGTWSPRLSLAPALLCLAGAAARDEAYARLRGPALAELLEHGIFPCVRFGERDLALWREDPEELVRELFNGAGEALSEPRAAAVELTERLLRHRKADVIAPLLQFCDRHLEALAQNPGDMELCASADGALLLLGSVGDELVELDPTQADSAGSRKKKKAPAKPKADVVAGSFSVEDFLARHVRPLLASPVAFLRLRACWVCERLAGKARRLGPPGAAAATCSECLQLLADAELPVRVVAASCLQAFLLREGDEEVRKVVAQNLAELLERLLRVLTEVPGEDVAEALEVLVESFPDEIVPFAAQLVGQLAGQFCQMAAAEAADDNRAGVVESAALGSATTILSVLRACAGTKDSSDTSEWQRRASLFGTLADTLLPLVLRILQPDGVDFIEAGLEMLGYLTAFCPSPLPAPLWVPFTRMYLAVCGAPPALAASLPPAQREPWAPDFMPCLLPPLVNFIACGPPQALHGGRWEEGGLSYLEMVFGIFSKVIQSPGIGAEAESNAAARLAAALFEHSEAPALDAWLPRYFDELRRRLASAETARFWRGLLQGLAAMLWYNADLFLQCAESSGCTLQVFEFWIRHASGASRSLAASKQLLLSELRLVQLACVPQPRLPAAVAQGLNHVVRLLAAQTKDVLRLRREKERAETGDESGGEEDDEEEDDDDAADDFAGARMSPLDRLDELALLGRTLQEAPSAVQQQVDAWLNGELALWIKELAAEASRVKPSA
eukprot:TRINITY_DN6646_c0_g5_i1.p1 TRINITY_DN6646_c0_g5~~TRINITY_DN6646_c0_g5_i1.p1  ORF type:complete len:1054 (+),score=291.07 TRINITY_DN6646_c0_g5_i1:95-3256(+)